MKRVILTREAILSVSSIFMIDYGYYDDCSFASRLHNYDGPVYTQYCSFDKMMQFICEGALSSTAMALCWDADGYVNNSQQNTRYDDLGQQNHLSVNSDGAISFVYDGEEVIANPTY